MLVVMLFIFVELLIFVLLVVVSVFPELDFFIWDWLKNPVFRYLLFLITSPFWLQYLKRRAQLYYISFNFAEKIILVKIKVYDTNHFLQSRHISSRYGFIYEFKSSTVEVLLPNKIKITSTEDYMPLELKFRKPEALFDFLDSIESNVTFLKRAKNDEMVEYKCENCGSDTFENATFCESCGSSLL